MAFPDQETLPRPQSKRWAPLRSGLLNIYKYDNEEFWYEDGKLLLRGNNGAGKSRILALQLPFLLDGEISSHRVEPDGDPAKSMDWNLLMGKHNDRLGYTWIEFGRIDEEGKAHYYTLGCALRAVKGKRIHNRWYFTTPLRVGEDFVLLSKNNIPLSKDKLIVALADQGSVYEQAKDYRGAIDKALFSLGSRYHALIELLIRLRKPQLSRKLDEALLSEALSEALSPLPQGLLEDAADAFRSLESNRTELDDFKNSLDGVERFLSDYKRYLQVATKRRCDMIRHANNAYENTRRKLNGYEQQIKQDRDAVESLGQTIQKTESAQQTARSELETLQSSPEMKSAENLETARQTAKNDQDTATKATERYLTSSQQVEERKKDLNQSETKADEEHKAADREFTAFRNSVKEVKLELDASTLPAEADRAWLQNQESGWAKSSSERRRAITHLKTRNRELVQAEHQASHADRDYIKAESRHTQASENSAKADTDLKAAVKQLIRDYHVWQASLKHMEVPDGDQFALDYSDWLETGDQAAPNPLIEPLKAASADAQKNLAEHRAALHEAGKNLQKELEAKKAELQSLEDGHQDSPPAPHHRDPESRDKLPGAPLWQLVDFCEDVPAEQRAGFEAALEASSILDAWICPDGTVHHTQAEDIFLRAEVRHSPQLETDSLARILSPSVPTDNEQAAAMTPELIANILGQIGGRPEAGETWVSHDGSWRLGTLEGKWSKPEIEYIGFAAREERRKNRIAQIQSQIEGIEAHCSQNQAKLETCELSQSELNEEIQSTPDETPRIDASSALKSAKTAESAALREMEQMQAIRDKMRAALEAAKKQRDADASDLGLFDWREDLDGLADKQATLETTASQVWRSIEGWLRSSAELRRNRELFDDAAKANESNKRQADEANAKAQASRVKYETLEKNIGADVKEIMATIDKVEKRLERLKGELSEQRGKETEFKISIGKLEGSQENATQELERHRSERAERIEKLFLFAQADLLAEQGFELKSESSEPWAPAPAMEIVRSIDEKLGDIRREDALWGQLQTNMLESIRDLRDELSSRNQDAHTETIDDGIYVVRCNFQGKDHPMSTVRRLLEEEVTNRSQLLEEREREIIENHLVGEIASEIQRLIREGEEWVRQMNEELSLRPTSSGIMLRFAWRVHPDGPAGLDEARKQLLRSEGVWSNADREAIGNFLQQQIQAQQLSDETATWQEQLARALDYRKWHRFEIERKQDGVWKRLTKKTYGTGSGGEKAIALTIPQFAAAAAHYRSAAPTAPRLIMLDEAFVGIDSATRSKLMGLLATFDLDLVMTSEREWGCYPTVSGLAIYQLSAHPSIDAVGVTRWVWNGKERKQIEQPAPASIETEEAVDSDQAHLFAGDSD